MLGVILSGTLISAATKTRFRCKTLKHGRVIPEERLPPMIIGAAMLPVGLF
jgi:phosphotransferase system  glucose/maltose/N-acetylglucosamine-specific IIC component